MAPRKNIQTRDEIIAALKDAMEAVAAWAEAQSAERFAWGPQGRWSAGQHVEHLVRSVQPLNMGLRLPKFVIGLVFGRARRPSMGYAELAAKYEGTLDAGGKASGRYVPPAVPAARRAKVLAAHRRECQRLVAVLSRWGEEELDQYVAKHPLLGAMTLRELLFFTIHHHDHHFETLQRDYAG